MKEVRGATLICSIAPISSFRESSAAYGSQIQFLFFETTGRGIGPDFLTVWRSIREFRPRLGADASNVAGKLN
jgi:hypothetical protein